MKAIVLAGGSGTRLWPLSRESFPKQFLRFKGEKSLLQKTVLRLLKMENIDTILISTSKDFKELVEKEVQSLPNTKNIHILEEPFKRNTAPAIALSMRYLEKHCQLEENEPVLVLPSDQWLEPEIIFSNALKQIQSHDVSDHLITFGIQPTKPETGYGYIQMAKPKGALLFSITKFIEKPDLETATKYIKDPRYFWNAGIFVFSKNSFWHEISLHAPQIYPLRDVEKTKLDLFYEKLPNISIDYALFELSKKVLLCPLSLFWSDIGCFDSLYDTLEKDSKGNVKIGNVHEINTKNSLIIGKKRLISTVDVENLLIVETEDAIFISKRGQSQKVKNLVSELLKSKNKHFTR